MYCITNITNLIFKSNLPTIIIIYSWTQRLRWPIQTRSPSDPINHSYEKRRTNAIHSRNLPNTTHHWRLKFLQQNFPRIPHPQTHTESPSVSLKIKKITARGSSLKSMFMLAEKSSSSSSCREQHPSAMRTGTKTKKRKKTKRDKRGGGRRNTTYNKKESSLSRARENGKVSRGRGPRSRRKRLKIPCGSPRVCPVCCVGTAAAGWRHCRRK